MIKKIIAALLFLSLSFGLFSCGEDYSHCELTLSLTEDFERRETDEFDLMYSNGACACALLRISFAAAITQGIPDYLTAYEFGKTWLKICGRESTVITLPEVDYCEYYESQEKTDYYYLAAFYRSPYAYFVVLYCVDKSLESEWSGRFLKFAKTSFFNDWKE